MHLFCCTSRYLIFFYAFRTLWREQNLHRGKHNLKVLDNTRLSYVHQIHNQFVVGRCVVFSVHLCVTRQASLSLEAQRKLRHFLAVLGRDFGALRTGPTMLKSPRKMFNS